MASRSKRWLFLPEADEKVLMNFLIKALSARQHPDVQRIYSEGL